MADRVPFCGRDRELQLVVGALVLTRSGAPTRVLVEGEPGAGKSRLIAEALANVDGIQAVIARCDELDQHRPFGALLDAFACTLSSPDPARAAVAAATRDHTIASDGGTLYVIVDSFVALAERMCLEQPLALVIEDLHWADDATALTVGAFARRLANLPVATVVTARPSPRRAATKRTLLGPMSDDTTSIMLGPLEPTAVQQLVRAAGGGSPGARLLTAVERAAGNPLYITEMVAALASDGMIERNGDTVEMTEDILPPPLRVTLLRRLAFLPDDTLSALRTATLLGTTFDVELLAAACGTSITELTSAVEPALESGLIEARGDHLAFRHDLIREALYEERPAPIRRALHLETGGRLRAAGASSLRIAEQYLNAEVRADAEVGEVIARAADEASHSSPTVAIEMLERALATADPGPIRDRLLLSLVRPLSWVGHYDRCIATARELFDRTEDVAARTRLQIAIVRAMAGQDAVGIETEIDRLLALDPPGDDDRLHAMLTAAHAANECLAYARAERLSEATAEAAERAGDVLHAEALMIRSAMHMNLGRHPKAIEDGELAVAVARRAVAAGEPRGEATLGAALVVAGTASMYVDRPEEAIPLLKEARVLLERAAAVAPLADCLDITGWINFRAGRWDEAVADWRALAEMTELLGMQLYRGMYHALCFVAYHRNDHRMLEEMIVAEHRRARDSGSAAEVGTDWFEAYAIADRDPTRAAELIEHALVAYWPGMTSYGPVDAVRCLLSIGRRDIAEDVYALADRRLTAQEDRGAVVHARGLLDDDIGALVTAVEETKVSEPFVHAAALEDCATASAQRGDRERAADFYDRALEIYDRLGMDRDLARMLKTMRTVGMPRRRRARVTRATQGWDALTRAERDVALLASEGLTNPQIGERLFISRHTVQTHLSRVFAKLGIASRVELAAAVARAASSS